MQIYLVRHPPTLNADGLCYGCLEVEVTPQAVAAAAEAVSAQIPGEALGNARIFCSPASRCIGLARRIASPHEPTAAEDLMEMNFGQWQGLAWDAVPRDELDAWAQDVWHYRPGGGESASMVATRWQRWLGGLQQLDAHSVIAVTHAGVIRVALGALDACIPFDSVHRLEY
ncbi:MAG: histidine phosphatase family protein [Steroidobacteraceae bacterium]